MNEVLKDFDIEKAEELFLKTPKKERLKRAFIRDLINSQNFFSKSILFQELLIEKRYPRHLIASTLRELGYELLLFKRNSTFKKESDRKEPEFHLIMFGPQEE